MFAGSDGTGADLADLYTWSVGAIGDEPADEISMRPSVLTPAHRRGHKDLSLDQFGFLHVWHCSISTLEFGAREPVTVL